MRITMKHPVVCFFSLMVICASIYCIIFLIFIVMDLVYNLGYFTFRVPQDLVATGGKCLVYKWVTGKL